jgi:hypothetical protein
VCVSTAFTDCSPYSSVRAEIARLEDVAAVQSDPDDRVACRTIVIIIIRNTSRHSKPERERKRTAYYSKLVGAQERSRRSRRWCCT